MTQAEPDPSDTQQARRIGGQTAAAVAVVTTAVLVALAWPSRGLVLSVVAAGAGVALFSAWAGRVAGARILRGGWPQALAVGALGGLAALLAAAVLAAGGGALWAVYDRTRDPNWLYDYVGKPFVGVLAYGGGMALLLGVVTGALVRWQLRGLRRP